MLILVAGVSGNMGRYLIEHGTAAGHQIRGFGRSPSKLSSEMMSKLESFVQCERYNDHSALMRAVSGVDAVICSYQSQPSAVLDSQLALLRATEEVGVKIYHANSWNYDWTRIRFGDWEHYDAYIAFRRHAKLTCSFIKPVYTFTGVLGEYATNQLFGIAHVAEDPPDGGKKVMAHWGAGDEKWNFTYLEDAARFTISLLTTNEDVKAGKGGLFRIESGHASARDLASVYEKVKGEKIKLKSLGGVPELEAQLRTARTSIPASQYFAYSHFFVQLANSRGIWTLENPVVVGGSDAVERLL